MYSFLSGIGFFKISMIYMMDFRIFGTFLISKKKFGFYTIPTEVHIMHFIGMLLVFKFHELHMSGKDICGIFNINAKIIELEHTYM